MESLAHLTSPESLWLDDTQITGAGLVHLENMSNLKELSLDRSQIGDDDLKALATLESLEYLFLSGTNVTEDGLAHLQDLPNLRHVSLDNTEVSEDAASEFNAGLNQ